MIILFIFFFIIDIILFEFISFFFPVLATNNELYSILFIFIHGSSVLFCIIIEGDKYKHIFIVAFILRLFIMFVDLYHIFPILHSGSDTEAFHIVSLMNQTSPEKLTFTNYTNLVTFIYSITHSSRFIAQYVNLLFGISILFILKKSFELFSLNSKATFTALCIAACMPNFVIFSCILLREAWIEFFVTLSIYYFLHWSKTANSLSSLMAIFSVLLAAYMHDGTIVLVGGYIVAILIYNPKSESIEVSQQSIFGLVVLSILFIFFIGNASLFTGKLGGIDSADQLTEAVNISAKDAGSAYLTWIHSDNLIMSILFAPLKMFYFLFSPLPTNWRGLADIVAFCIDSSIYVFLSFNIYKSSIKEESNLLLRKFLLFSLILSVFVFAFGTFTAGTAMRHRAKLLPLFLVLYCLSQNDLSTKNR